jgi:Mn2+/Fe2+ NRAMP family transporter
VSSIADNRIIRKIALGLSAIGPGLFLIGYNIGTGSITTMAKAGAEYGMTLFWALVLSCIFTYILLVAYGKTTLVTGKTALNNIKNQFKFGKILAIYILIAVILGELLALMGIFGIVTDLLKEGSRILVGGEGISTLWLTIVLVVILFFLYWTGRYITFEKILTGFVIFMALSFIVVFVMVKPNLSVILQGLIPSIPREPGSFGIVAAMAGTTCSAAVFIVRSTVVAEKGWKLENLKTEKKDAMASASMMLFLSAVIMAVSAGTLHVMGLKLTDTVEMIYLFQPIGGNVAAFVLILGIAGAGISTIFPIILIAPWLISDYMGKPRNIKSPMYRILGLLGLLFGFTLQFVEQRPPAVMIFSQAFQACILPAVTIAILLLINSERLMGNHRAKSVMNISLLVVLIFSFFTTYLAISELL